MSADKSITQESGIHFTRPIWQFDGWTEWEPTTKQMAKPYLQICTNFIYLSCLFIVYISQFLIKTSRKIGFVLLRLNSYGDENNEKKINTIRITKPTLISFPSLHCSIFEHLMQVKWQPKLPTSITRQPIEESHFSEPKIHKNPLRS